MILLYSDLHRSVCLVETCGIVSLYGLAEQVGKVSIKILNFTSLLTGMSVPSRSIPQFVLNILEAKTNSVIFYTIFVNTQETVVLFQFQKEYSLLLKHLP